MSNPHYKIMKDDATLGKFRVAHYGSEYTVSYKKQLQHGLSHQKARQVLSFLESKRLAAIDRLAEALTEFREKNPPPARQQAFINSLSVKHRIDPKSIRTGILMEVGAINVRERTEG